MDPFLTPRELKRRAGRDLGPGSAYRANARVKLWEETMCTYFEGSGWEEVPSVCRYARAARALLCCACAVRRGLNKFERGEREKR